MSGVTGDGSGESGLWTLWDGRVLETTLNSCPSRKPTTLPPDQTHALNGCLTEALDMRQRKALPALDKVSVRMKIAFQKNILDHVTPWLKSFQKFSFLLVYRKNSFMWSSEPRLSGLHRLSALSLPSGSYHALPSLSLLSMASPATRHLHKCFLLTGILLNVEVKEWEEWQEAQGLRKMRRIVVKT